MKLLTFSLAALASFTALAAEPQGRSPQAAPPPKDIPPPVSTVPAAPAGAKETFVYPDQKVMGGRPLLVSQQQITNVVSRFKSSYETLGKPRMLLYINRELVDERSGIKLSSRHEKTGSIQSSTVTTNVITAENRYHITERPAGTLADQQTIRDIERVFGRALRQGGAKLVDQKIAVQMLPDHSLAPHGLLEINESARKDREALAKVADVVVEILISTKTITLPGLSGDQTFALPDMQATAIRLKDAAMLGQAASTDITSRDPARIARFYKPAEIMEATALALMEDISSSN